MKERMTTAAEHIVKGKLLSQGISASEAAVTINFDFDKERLGADSLQYYQTWYQTLVPEAAANRKQEFESQQNDIKQIAKLLGYEDLGKAQQKKIEEPKKQNNGGSGSPSSPRLGSFNLDLLGMTFPDPVSQQDPSATKNTKDEEAQPRLPFTLGIQVGARSGNLETPPAFSFDLADYITDVRIDVILPTSAPETIDNEIRKALADGLGVKEKIGQALDKKIVISRAPVVKESYFQQLLKPQSGLISAVAGASVAGLLLLAAAFLILKGISKLAVGLSELKPKAEVSAEKEDTAAAVVQQVAGGDEEEEEKDGMNDPNAMSRMLAADMGMVRGQIAEIMKQDLNAVAEVLRDFVGTQGGMSDLKDLVTFIGFEVLSPALDILPRKILNEFSAYIEDTGSERSNPLNGIELAQRLNREYVARRTKTAADAGGTLKALRRELVLIEDEALGRVFLVADIPECALLLKVLSLERTQQFLKKIPPEIFRDAYKMLDEDVPDAAKVATRLVAKISDAQKQGATKGSAGQKRMMLRILKQSTPDDEEFIQSLVANDDWEMKSLMMKTRFLFRDLPYVQTNLVKQAFDSFPLVFRGELAFCCNQEQRSTFLKLYPEGAKGRELLSAEIAQIEKNDKRRTNVEKNRNVYIQQFLDTLHKIIAADAHNIEEILLRQAQAIGDTLPGTEPPGSSEIKKVA
jgi:hypothetical protein